MGTMKTSDALTQLMRAQHELEQEYVNNEGEVTECTEAKEAQIAALKELLVGEGIDRLGRWLKSKEDEKKALKAEKDYLTRRMGAIDGTMDYCKQQIGLILRATGQEKVKGQNGYTFSQYTSEKFKADTDAIKCIYLDKAKAALRGAGIPEHITCTLGCSTTLLPEGEPLPDYIVKLTTETSKFVKPRASKEEE